MTTTNIAVAFAIATPLVLSGCANTGINLIDDSVAKVKGTINNKTDEFFAARKQSALITKGCLEKGQDDGHIGGITREAVEYFNDANGSNFTIENISKDNILSGKICTQEAPSGP